MANTNTISQAASYRALQNTGKTNESVSASDKDSGFQSMLDKATGNQDGSDNSLKKPVSGSSKDKCKNTKDPLSGNENIPAAQGSIPGLVDPAALAIQSMADAFMGGFDESNSKIGAELTNPLILTEVVVPQIKNPEIGVGKETENQVSLLMGDVSPETGTVKEETLSQLSLQKTDGEGNPSALTSEHRPSETKAAPMDKTAAPELRQQDGSDKKSEIPALEKGDRGNSVSLSHQDSQEPVKAVSQLENQAAEKKDDTKTTQTSTELFTVKEAPLQKTEVVTVKVAEPYRQVDNKAMEQIAGNVKDSVELGRDELIIQLSPEHLGRIAIKISMAEDGIKVVLNCENMKTQNLLADKAAGIGKIVEDNMNTSVTVEVKEDGYWNQQKDATDQHSNSRQQEQKEGQSKDDTDLFIQQLRLGLTGVQAS